MMNNKLTISLIQANLWWEDREKNHQSFNQLMNQAEISQIFLLPEMFSTGFSMNTQKIAETMQGESVNWMKAKAIEKNALILGSLCILDSGKTVNRMVAAYPEGVLNFYDKRHLFRMGIEDQHFHPGSERKVIEYRGWKIRLLICYDLRFPVWSRNRNDYNLLVYVANWPASRRDVWQKLLLARAIENQCYVAAVNRVGKDGNNLDHCGDSMIIDPKGNILAHLPQNKEGCLTAMLDLDELIQFRKNFPAWMDADEFEIKKCRII